MIKSYIIDVGAWLSAGLNTILLPGGNHKVTTSARIGKKILEGKKWAVVLDKIISFVLRDPNHSVGVYERDRQKAKCAHD